LSLYSLHSSAAANEIVVAGHSHVLAVMHAIADSGRSDMAVAYTSNPVDGVPLDDSYWDYVHEVSAGKAVAVMWNGNQHHALFLIEPEPPFSVWPALQGQFERSHGLAVRTRRKLARVLRLPHSRDVNAGVSLVPRSMLQAMWAPTFAQLEFALSLLVPDRDVIVVSTPPPKRQVVVEQNLSSEAWFVPVAERMGVDIADLPVTDEFVRLAMWKTLHAQLADTCRAYGVPVVPVPSEATDSDGFLLPEYSAPDATHANAEYGRIMCEAMAMWVSK
jgi:hypothetical protein